MSMSGICAMKGNVMEYFKLGEQMMCYSVSDTDKFGKRKCDGIF